MPHDAGDPAPGVLTWKQRSAAVALPAAAVLIGGLAPRSRVATALAMAGPLTAVLSSVALTRAAAAARDASNRTTGTEPRSVSCGDVPRLSVVIPARDEAAVIGALIADLGMQDHRDAAGTPHFEVIVIDDRSADGTREVASAALRAAALGDVSRVMRRAPGAASGKGAALADVPLSELRGEAMMVLDADARIAPGFLRRAAEILADGNTAVTARRRMLAPVGGRGARLLAAVQDDEQTVDGAVQAGRWALRAGSEFRGDGSAIHVDALRQAGGWDPGALCEDLELSGCLLVARADSVAWDPTLVVWEQPVVELRALLRQRLRWAEGLVRRELRVTPSVLTSSCLSNGQRAIVLAYSAQSLAPLVALGLLVRVRSRRARRLLLATAASYALGGVMLGGGALGDGALGDDARDPHARSMATRLVRAIAVVAFSAAWLVLLPVAWLRAALHAGPPHFARTRHTPGFSDPPSSESPATAR